MTVLTRQCWFARSAAAEEASFARKCCVRPRSTMSSSSGVDMPAPALDMARSPPPLPCTGHEQAVLSRAVLVTLAGEAYMLVRREALTRHAPCWQPRSRAKC